MVADPPPLITVIVAVYNAGATLQQCIDSFAMQTYREKELIIIDGGSTDGSASILEKNGSICAYRVSEPDAGIYNAWNKGLVHAKGEWICFLGADDYFWDESVLARMAALLAEVSATINVAYGRITRLDEIGNAIREEGAPWPQLKARFRQFMCLPHPALMHRRNLFERHGFFDESFRIAGDYELLMRELNTAEAEFFSGVMVAGVRAGGISTVRANTLLALRELRRAQRMHGQIFPGPQIGLAIMQEHARLIVKRTSANRWVQKLVDWVRASKP